MAMNIITTLPAGDPMFKIIVDGEVVETVMHEDEYAIKEYIREEYEYYGEKAKYEKIGE